MARKTKRQKLEERLLAEVMKEIVQDVCNGETEAVEAILTYIPAKHLVYYLSEHRWPTYKALMKAKKLSPLW